jgi:hypothetical protein
MPATTTGPPPGPHLLQSLFWLCVEAGLSLAFAAAMFAAAWHYVAQARVVAPGRTRARNFGTTAVAAKVRFLSSLGKSFVTLVTAGGKENLMGVILFVLLLALLFGGLGFAAHSLWIIAVVVFFAWLVGFGFRMGEGSRWYRW